MCSDRHGGGGGREASQVCSSRHGGDRLHSCVLIATVESPGFVLPRTLLPGTVPRKLRALNKCFLFVQMGIRCTKKTGVNPC